MRLFRIVVGSPPLRFSAPVTSKTTQMKDVWAGIFSCIIMLKAFGKRFGLPKLSQPPKNHRCTLHTPGSPPKECIRTVNKCKGTLLPKTPSRVSSSISQGSVFLPHTLSIMRCSRHCPAQEGSLKINSPKIPVNQTPGFLHFLGQFAWFPPRNRHPYGLTPRD